MNARAGWITSRYVAGALVVLAAATVAVSFYGNRDRWNRADFYLYYSWWSEFRRGIDPWNPPASAFATVTPGQPTAGFCNYPPGFVVFLSPFAALGQQTAYWVWLVLLLGTLALSLILLARELRPRPGGISILSIVALALLFPHVHGTLHGAQPTFLLLLLLSAAWVFERRSLPAGAGLMLALATLLKAYPGAVGGYFLFRRRFRTVGWAMVFGVLGLVLTGADRWYEFVALGTPKVDFVLRQERMVAVLCNVFQMLAQLFCPARRCDLWVAALAITAVIDLLVIAVAGMVTVNAAEDSDVDGLCFGVWLIAALLLSPMSWDHELPLLIPAYLFAIAGVAKGRPASRAALALLALGFAGSVLPVFAVQLRHLHFYFLSTVATLVAASMLVNKWSGPPPSPAAAAAAAA